MQDFRINN